VRTEGQNHPRRTPGPWTVSADGRTIIAVDLSHVAYIPKWAQTDGPANAEFIVRACNSHYDLLAALTLAVETIRARQGIWFPTHEPSMTAMTAIINAAIAKAEGGH
jgi:hypothetical protein